MGPDQAVELARKTLEISLVICGPILVFATVIGLVVSVLQVVTSIQDTTVSTVPRLAAVALSAFFLTPWMFHKMVFFTLSLLGNLHPYLH
ncbi:MAG: flagellar biosynthetic protein FliQ [Terriglobales bacterium]